MCVCVCVFVFVTNNNKLSGGGVCPAIPVTISARAPKQCSPHKLIRILTATDAGTPSRRPSNPVGKHHVSAAQSFTTVATVIPSVNKRFIDHGYSYYWLKHKNNNVHHCREAGLAVTERCSLRFVSSSNQQKRLRSCIPARMCDVALDYQPCSFLNADTWQDPAQEF